MNHQINKINNTSMSKLKFKNFNIKTGNDKYSKMRLENLIKNSSLEDIEFFKTQFNDDTLISQCLRFKLRGIIDNNKVVRIVKTKKEISDNARYSNIDIDETFKHFKDTGIYDSFIK